MFVYRLTPEKYASDLSGEGARLFGGRWNSKGHRMLYTSTSRSLAILEVLVNIDKRFLPKDMVMFSIEIVGSSDVKSLELPAAWREVPFQRTTQKCGDSWLITGEFAISVPSLVVPQESNILINPQVNLLNEHLLVRKIELFSFDARLFTND